jgi:Outer membrane protein beta-barrel domain
MRKIVLLCGLVLALSLSAMAQEQPRIDVFAGYSYIRFNAVGDTHANLNGGSGSVAFYPSRRWGVVGDFGGYKISTITSGGVSASVDEHIISYLFGPRIRFGGDKLTPFGQVLFGGAHLSTTPATGTSENVFAMTAGGGVDLKVARHFSVRGQAEYLMTKFTDGANNRQNNARISAGIVIH